MGILLGAFVTAFFLLDDMTASKTNPASPTVAANKLHVGKAAKKVDVATQQSGTSTNEAKPTAVAAEALDLDSLPQADDGGVMSTAKRDDTEATPAPQTH